MLQWQCFTSWWTFVLRHQCQKVDKLRPPTPNKVHDAWAFPFSDHTANRCTNTIRSSLSYYVHMLSMITNDVTSMQNDSKTKKQPGISLDLSVPEIKKKTSERDVNCLQHRVRSIFMLHNQSLVELWPQVRDRTTNVLGPDIWNEWPYYLQNLTNHTHMLCRRLCLSHVKLSPSTQVIITKCRFRLNPTLRHPRQSIP